MNTIFFYSKFQSLLNYDEDNSVAPKYERVGVIYKLYYNALIILIPT